MTKNRLSKKRIIYITFAIVCIILFAACVYFALNPNRLKPSAVGFDTQSDFVCFTDVGQGDCAIIYSNGYCSVIDVGLPNAAPQIYEDLSKYNVKKIDVALISHLHSDHIGSLQRLADDFEIDNLIMPELLNSSIAAASNSKRLITEKGGSFYNAVGGMNFEIGEFEVTVLGYFDDKTNENNRSLFVMAEIDGVKFLFTGDAESKAEKYLLEQAIKLDCDILKVSHHGSNSSTCSQFLENATPRYAVVSVGENNMYRHPNVETLRALKESKAKIYRTDRQGDITFNIQNGKIKVNTEKQP